MTVEIRQSNPGWLEALKSRYKDKSELAMGYPKGSESAGLSYPDGTELLTVAAANNYGVKSKNIPARPFMTEGADPAIEKTAPIAERLMPKLNDGTITKEQLLKTMGPVAQAEFQKAITELDEPENAPETIRRKGSSNPLVDTGLLQQSFTYAVRGEE